MVQLHSLGHILVCQAIPALMVQTTVVPNMANSETKEGLLHGGLCFSYTH
jgi:hypothetical protein